MVVQAIKKILFVIIVLISVPAFGSNDWKYKGQFNFGCNLNFNYHCGQKFPGLKIFAGFGINSVYQNHFVANYGSSLAFYTKSLGNNLNPLRNDFQIDFTNSFDLGYGHNDISYTKYFRTINNSPYYNSSLQKDYAFLLGTNFILNMNDSKRNQTIGSIICSFPGVTVNYYNDGGPPIQWLGIGDNFDRLWTGGAGIFVHNSHYKKDYNYAEITFDQFTGYAPLLHELSNLIGINDPSYNMKDPYVTEENLKNTPSFNTSAYNLKIFPMKGYGIDVGVLGSLRCQSDGMVWGLQDIIHTVGGLALHPNNDINRVFVGGTYNNLSDVDF